MTHPADPTRRSNRPAGAVPPPSPPAAGGAVPSEPTSSGRASTATIGASAPELNRQSVDFATPIRAHSRRSLVRNEADCRERLGLSRASVVRTARERLAEAFGFTAREEVDALLAARGVRFRLMGHSVTVRRDAASGRSAIWAVEIGAERPLEV